MTSFKVWQVVIRTFADIWERRRLPCQCRRTFRWDRKGKTLLTQIRSPINQSLSHQPESPLSHCQVPATNHQDWSKHRTKPRLGQSSALFQRVATTAAQNSRWSGVPVASKTSNSYSHNYQYRFHKRSKAAIAPASLNSTCHLECRCLSLPVSLVSRILPKIPLLQYVHLAPPNNWEKP